MQTLSTIRDSLGSIGHIYRYCLHVDAIMEILLLILISRLPMLTINITPTVKVRFSSCLKQKIQKFNELIK